MKKGYVYIIILIISIIFVLFGIYGLVDDRYSKVENQHDNDVQNIFVENETSIATSYEKEKISPNCSFALKKYYDECNHFDYEEAELPTELVNLTKDEVENYYEGWKIESFSSDKLVLSKEINGYCNQHFIIKLDDNNINVYRIGKQGELDKYKSTNISVDYLPEEDLSKLELGIPVYGEGKLSSVLEDYE